MGRITRRARVASIAGVVLAAVTLLAACVDPPPPPPPPAASFDASPTTGDAPLNVRFTDTSTGAIRSWSWDFGDGATSSSQNPSHTYDTPGTYTAELTVAGVGRGTRASTTITVTDPSPPAPVASFTATPTTGEAPLAVTFTDASTGAITAWSWDFGDGTTSTEQSPPTHTYTTTGDYTVSLTVTGPGGTGQDARTITVTGQPAPPVASFSGSPTTGMAPLQVSFSDASTGAITTWSWDFGDDTSSTEQNPSHVFGTPGNHRVSLSVAGPGGSSQTSQTIAVSPPPAPVASFDASPSSGEVPLTVSFTDTSSGPVTQWLWNFGDGTTSTEQHPTHTYLGAGLYVPFVIVTGPGGNDLASQQISVTSPPLPVADFSVTPSAGNAPLAVTIAEASTGPITSWAWDFGDGTTSADQHPPVHTYANAGNYFVTLTVAGPGGNNTAMRGISVFPRPPNERPAVTITAPASPSTFTPGESITFAGSALDDRDGDVSGNIAWSSDIDGALGTGSTIIVSTLSSGFHTITASVTDADGLTGSNPVGVRVNAPPVVSITSPSSGSTFTFGQPIAFAGTATDLEDGDLSDRLNWRSDLDGTLSDLPSFSNATLSVGTHTITAEASDLLVTGTASITVTIVPPAPVASFDATPASGEVPLTVAFTDTSTGAITATSWDLGDGTTSSAASLTHRYDTVGSYTVTLTVTGPGGTVQATGVITVNPPPQPVGSFVATPTTGDVPLTVRFTDASTGPITSWSWDFGDGATSTERNPTHTYSAVGTYLAALTVTGPGGFHSVGQYISVTAPPVASFDASTTSGDAPLAVTFTDTSTGTVDSRSWDFDDGASSTERNPTHTYTTPGTYVATLTLTGPTGTDQATKTITVTTPPAPVASFSASLNDGTLTYVFTDRSSGNISSWAWNFGDGATSTAQHPTHSYELWGSPHTITLTVTGLGGTSQFSLTVNPPFPAPPVASFTASPTSGDAPLTVQFTDTSTGALWMNPSLTPWVWDFGDGTTSYLQNPTHIYTTPGSYSVRLIRYGAGGGDDVFGTITVNAPPPVASFTAPTDGVAPLTVNFVDTSVGEITTWSWDFGDFRTSSLQNPVRVFGLQGVYTVTLTITGPGGTDSTTRTIEVRAPPILPPILP